MADESDVHDDQAEAEAFDESKVGAEPLDPSDAPTFPAERYLGATDSTADDRVTDSVASRAERELPDFDEAEGPAHARETVRADIDDLDDDRPPLRLVGAGDEDVDDGPDDEADLVARAVRSDPDDLSAEEAAVHLE